jgi:hypothetical protein
MHECTKGQRHYSSCLNICSCARPALLLAHAISSCPHHARATNGTVLGQPEEICCYSLQCGVAYSIYTLGRSTQGSAGSAGQLQCLMISCNRGISKLLELLTGRLVVCLRRVSSHALDDRQEACMAISHRLI